jgi:hypothetical protein
MSCTRHGYIPALPVWGVLLVGVVGWPLCAYGPIAARVAWMERQVRSQVPVMPELQNVSVNADWLGNESVPPESCIEFETNASQQSVFTFYRQQFSARGWSEDYTSAYAEYAQANGLPRLFFQKSGYVLSIDFTVMKTAQNRTATPPNNVEVCYRPG